MNLSCSLSKWNNLSLRRDAYRKRRESAARLLSLFAHEVESPYRLVANNDGGRLWLIGNTHARGYLRAEGCNAPGALHGDDSHFADRK